MAAPSAQQVDRDSARIVRLPIARYTEMSGAEHELKEARSEIARHHTLIEKLRDALGKVLPWAWDFWEPSGDEEWAEELEGYARLLNREVG